jgi:hypothetical protein
MRPDELSELLTSMAQAAEVVEALDDPARQAARGWDLAGWSYDMVPWGVRFLYHDGRAVAATVVAVALPEARRAQLAPVYGGSPWPTTLLLLG